MARPWLIEGMLDLHGCSVSEQRHPTGRVAADFVGASSGSHDWKQEQEALAYVGSFSKEHCSHVFMRSSLFVHVYWCMIFFGFLSESNTFVTCQ